MTFTESLWEEIAGIYQAIIDHPFNRELAQGTLAIERFKFYIQQDALYLVDFSRALAMVGAKALAPERILDFLEFAKDGLVVERALHEEYFRRFDVTADVEQAPGCFAYTNYLVATASHRSLEEAVAALLPCFWIYREVGMHIVGQSAPDNPYQLWIDTYAGEEFAAAVRRAIDITEEVAAATTDMNRRRMTQAFVLSSRLEWMFWDSAYRMESWSP
jgi:thiaminase/transcriptional activator TenA